MRAGVRCRSGESSSVTSWAAGEEKPREGRENENGAKQKKPGVPGFSLAACSGNFQSSVLRSESNRPHGSREYARQ